MLFRGGRDARSYRGSRFNIPEEKLKSFLHAVEAGYHGTVFGSPWQLATDITIDKNPYHNSIHAADVTQGELSKISGCH